MNDPSTDATAKGLDLDAIRERFAAGQAFVGGRDITALIAEVERLRAVIDDLTGGYGEGYIEAAS